MKKLIVGGLAALALGSVIGLAPVASAAPGRPTLTAYEEQILPGMSVVFCSNLDAIVAGASDVKIEDVIEGAAGAVGSTAGAIRVFQASVYDYCPEYVKNLR